MEINAKEFKLWFTKELLNKRQLWLGDVNEEAVERITMSLALLNAQSTDLATLYIDSNGGDVTPGLVVYDTIRLSAAPVVGRVCGSANSMASVVLQACKERTATRHSTLLIHNIRRSVRLKMLLPDAENIYGRVNVDSMVKEWDPTIRSQGNIIKIYSERTGRTPTEIINAMNAEKVFIADEAKEFGLIDEVI